MRAAHFLLTLLYTAALSMSTASLLSTTTAAASHQQLNPPQCLYPHESETREVKSLDGLWHFVRSNQSQPAQGIRERWFAADLAASQPTIRMPVPASYNDITTDRELRDHVGTVWYDRRFFAPASWSANRRVWLRFGSVHYEALVWVNGVQVARHEFGHLPFQADITDALQFGAENRVTVLCDNALLANTVPQGKLVETATDTGTTMIQTYTFDFFNYAGIHRSVHLYTTPVVHIRSVQVDTTVLADATTGSIAFRVQAANDLLAEAMHNENASLALRVLVRDRSGAVVANSSTEPRELDGSVEVPDVRLWWPFLMSDEPGYLYQLEVRLVAVGVSEEVDELVLDVYRMAVGVRTLRWTETGFYVNDRPAYMRGFGKHEDSDIRGKGLDLALMTRDFDLLRWVGANAYRTSHYPYSEESMQFADEAGIMVIDECASVDTDQFSAVLLHKHKRSLAELVVRDRNHPSVIMWSIANEPRSQYPAADAYFGAVANFTRSLDTSRPLTAALAQSLIKDQAGRHLDIIGFNRYNGWYSNPGRLDMISERVVQEARAWHDKHRKPIMMLEYGADTIEGLHLLPSFVWTEDYQRQLFARHFRAFDVLQQQGFFVGEFIWNFADFKTNQAYTRVGGNKKGIFTRSRQPKAVAGLIRQRYYALAQSELRQPGVPELVRGRVAASWPKDLYEYVHEAEARMPAQWMENNELVPKT